MPQGLPRRIRAASAFQVALVSLVVVLGVLLADSWAQRRFLQQLGAAEAAQFWTGLATNPQHPAPRARLVAGYFVPADADLSEVPAPLAALPDGPHHLPALGFAHVESRPAGRLYLLYDRAELDRLLFWFNLLPLLAALLAVFAVGWLINRDSAQLLRPLNWLVREVGSWRPDRIDFERLGPEQRPVGLEGEARQLADALHGTAMRVQEFVRRERDFTRDASHELRTPLTVIRVASDLMLADPELSTRLQRSLGRIQRAGHDMEQLIDAFLILSRESDIEPLKETFSVMDVVHEEIAKITPACQAKGLTVKVVDHAAPMLHASPRVLGVMLRNLLDNACTYTDCGDIVVEVHDDRIVIRDSGIGMTAEAIERAFDPFYRVDQVNPLGKGMGLSIVRRLGDRFGWPVSLESVSDVGTIATIRFGTTA
ncbi:MAG TPA: HAMP domain-containing sensor histidine kinase [Xanthomonadaceae bacterium]|nr:HAMP domain-containing sensor histidine kinase [Xanthomonadaceae bacterium]